MYDHEAELAAIAAEEAESIKAQEAATKAALKADAPAQAEREAQAAAAKRQAEVQAEIQAKSAAAFEEGQRQRALREQRERVLRDKAEFDWKVSTADDFRIGLFGAMDSYQESKKDRDDIIGRSRTALRDTLKVPAPPYECWVTVEGNVAQVNIHGFTFSVSFDHDPDHARFTLSPQQGTSPVLNGDWSGTTLKEFGLFLTEHPQVVDRFHDYVDEVVAHYIDLQNQEG